MTGIKRYLFSLAVFVPPYLQAQGPDWELVKQGVVQVKSDEKLAAGIVSQASPGVIQIVTAAHVVRAAQNIIVLFPKEQDRPYKAQLLPGLSVELDLAVLEIRPQNDHLPLDIPSYGIRESATFQAGEPLCILDRTWTNSAARLTVPNSEKERKTIEYPSIAPTTAYPGSPVFDVNGQLVGIQIDGKKGQNSSAVKIEAVVDALTAAGHNLPNFTLASLDGKWLLTGYGPKNGVPSDPVDLVIKGQTFSIKIPNLPLTGQGTASYDGASLTLTLTGFVNEPSAPSPGANMTAMLVIALEQLNTTLFKQKLIRQHDGSFMAKLNLEPPKGIAPDLPMEPTSDPEPQKAMTIRLTRNISSTQ
jgi:hypothetical protein